MAEAYAARFGVQTACRFGFQRVVLESDSLVVVRTIIAGPNGRTPIFLFFDDIQNFRNLLEAFICVHVKRGGNCLAHLIAREHVEVGSERRQEEECKGRGVARNVFITKKQEGIKVKKMVNVEGVTKGFEAVSLKGRKEKENEGEESHDSCGDTARSQEGGRDDSISKLNNFVLEDCTNTQEGKGVRKRQEKVLKKKRTPNRMRELKEGVGRKGSEGNSGGLGLWWHDVNLRIESYSRHHIAAKVLDEQDRPLWLAVGLYGWAEQANKLHTWELIRNLVGQHQGPIIFFGDFNEILMDEEKEGGVCGGQRSMTDLKDVLDACWLRDLGYTGEKFTWQRGRSMKTLVRERLDRFVANDGWCRLFPAVRVCNYPIAHSDHAPIFIKAGKEENIWTRKKIFRFEALWLSNDECEEVVRRSRRLEGEGGMDKWVGSNIPTGYPNTRQGEENGLRVGNLIDVEQEKSNESLLEALFTAEEKESIKGIPLVFPLQQDELYWWPNIAGNYTVKSRYWTVCPICGAEAKTVTHALFACNKAKEIWESSQLHEILQATHEGDLGAILCRVAARGEMEDLIKFTSLAWACWFCRNKTVHEDQPFVPSMVAAGFVWFVEEYRLYS
ncbi:5'-nucleotidase domain-containing protein 1 [Bienertia sinuspersici]